jgi:hypothetical protein
MRRESVSCSSTPVPYDVNAALFAILSYGIGEIAHTETYRTLFSRLNADLELVHSNPSWKLPQIAKSMGVHHDTALNRIRHAYRVASVLVQTANAKRNSAQRLPSLPAPGAVDPVPNLPRGKRRISRLHDYTEGTEKWEWAGSIPPSRAIMPTEWKCRKDRQHTAKLTLVEALAGKECHVCVLIPKYNDIGAKHGLCLKDPSNVPRSITTPAVWMCMDCRDVPPPPGVDVVDWRPRIAIVSVSLWNLQRRTKRRECPRCSNLWAAEKGERFRKASRFACVA